MKFNNQTLRDAVKEWLSDSDTAETKYGQISDWDTSAIASTRESMVSRRHAAKSTSTKPSRPAVGP